MKNGRMEDWNTSTWLSTGIGRIDAEVNYGRVCWKGSDCDRGSFGDR